MEVVSFGSPGKNRGAAEKNQSPLLSRRSFCLYVAASTAGGIGLKIRDILNVPQESLIASKTEAPEEDLKHEIHGKTVHFSHHGMSYYISQPIPDQCELGEIEYSKTNGLRIPVTFRTMMMEKQGTVEVNAAFVEATLIELEKVPSGIRSVSVPYKLTPKDPNDTMLVEFLMQSGTLSNPLEITIIRAPQANPSSLAFANTPPQTP